MSYPGRPPQAAPTDPHWIVVSLSNGKFEVPVEKGRSYRFLFRHSTEAFANAECERLAKHRPGQRFAVYASGVSRKIDKPAPAEVAAPAGATRRWAGEETAPAVQPRSAPP